MRNIGRVVVCGWAAILTYSLAQTNTAEPQQYERLWTFWGSVMDWLGTPRKRTDLEAHLRSQNPWIEDSTRNPSLLFLSYLGLAESPLANQLTALSDVITPFNEAQPNNEVEPSHRRGTTRVRLHADDSVSLRKPGWLI